jgi:hypothetical protein
MDALIAAKRSPSVGRDRVARLEIADHEHAQVGEFLAERSPRRHQLLEPLVTDQPADEPDHERGFWDPVLPAHGAAPLGPSSRIEP